MGYVTLGKVINVRGLKGELKLYCSSDFSKERYKKGNKVSFYHEERNDRKEFTVVKFSKVGNNDYIMVEEITDVDQANKYMSYNIVIHMDGNETYLSGDGSKNNPFVVEWYWLFESLSI